MEKVKLGQLTNIKTGRLDVNAENPNGKYPFFTCSKNHTYIDEYAFDGESVLVAGNGDLNVKYYNGKFNAYQRTYVIQANENLNGKFLYYFLDSYVEKLREQSIGGVIKYIKLGNLTDAEIPLPNLATQQRIAAILDQADAIIQNNRAIVQKYDALTQSLFLDMFGDPVKNEKGWEKVRFDELVSKDCPLTYGIVQPGEEFEDGIPCVRPVDLTSQYIYVDELKRIDPKISSKFSRTLLKGGELLLSVRGSVGVISIADSSLVGSNVTRGIVPIWFDSEISNKLFFYYLYCTKEIQREVKALAKGATLIQINLKDLRELKIIKPPIVLQNQFAERVAMIEAQKQKAQLELAKSEELFNSLLQRAFKGELN